MAVDTRFLQKRWIAQQPLIRCPRPCWRCHHSLSTCGPMLPSRDNVMHRMGRIWDRGRWQLQWRRGGWQWRRWKQQQQWQRCWQQ